MKRIAMLFVIAMIGLWQSNSYALVKFGVRAGVNVMGELDINKLSASTLKNAQYAGFTVGPTVELAFLETGLFFSQESLTIKDFNDFKNLRAEAMTLQIPVNLKLRFGIPKLIGVFGYAGPFASYNISNFKETSQEVIDSFKSGKFNWGVNVGLGVSLFGHLDVGLNYQYKVSATPYKLPDISSDDLPDDMSKFGRGLYSVTATYYF